MPTIFFWQKKRTSEGPISYSGGASFGASFYARCYYHPLNITKIIDTSNFNDNYRFIVSRKECIPVSLIIS